MSAMRATGMAEVTGFWPSEMRRRLKVSAALVLLYARVALLRLVRARHPTR